MVLAILLAYVDRISHKLNQGWKQDHDQTKESLIIRVIRSPYIWNTHIQQVEGM